MFLLNGHKGSRFLAFLPTVQILTFFIKKIGNNKVVTLWNVKQTLQFFVFKLCSVNSIYILLWQKLLMRLLQQAAGEGMDAFIQVFTDAYKRVIGGELTADTMPLLTGEQHSLLAYQIFRDELMEGGFCQLVQKRIWWLYLCQSVCQSNAFCGEWAI